MFGFQSFVRTNGEARLPAIGGTALVFLKVLNYTFVIHTELMLDERLKRSRCMPFNLRALDIPSKDARKIVSRDLIDVPVACKTVAAVSESTLSNECVISL